MSEIEPSEQSRVAADLFRILNKYKSKRDISVERLEVSRDAFDCLGIVKGELFAGYPVKIIYEPGWWFTWVLLAGYDFFPETKGE